MGESAQRSSHNYLSATEFCMNGAPGCRYAGAVERRSPFKTLRERGLGRRFFRIVCGFASAAVLAGCAAMSDSVQEYSFVEVKYVTMPDDTYRVFDKPEENKMLVSSSIASATAQSLRANLMLKNDTPPKANFEAAALEYLSSDGRSGCRVKESYLLIAPQFEVKYDCAPVVAAPAKKGGVRKR